MLANSTGSSTATAVTTSSANRLSGLVSGLDTDTLVQQLTSGTQSKIDKAGQKKQKAAWRQDAYRSITSALQEFQTKYLSTNASSTSILSADYFNVSTINNTSAALSISGNADAAKNMVITKISQLAKQATFTSAHDVSTEALTTGTVKSSWSPNSIDGGSITVNYGGTDYSIAIDSDFVYDKGDDVSNVVAELNNSISKNNDLNGKLAFTKLTDSTSGKDYITLTSTDKSFYIKDGTSSLLSGLGISKDATATAVTSVNTDHSSYINSDSFFTNTLAAGSYLNIQIAGDTNTYALKINSAVQLSSDTATYSAALSTALNAAISSNSNLSGKISASVDSSGQVTIKKADGSSISGFTITGGSENMTQGLNLQYQSADGSYVGSSNRDSLVASYLGDTLSGSTLTFSLNGLSKTITFDATDESKYLTPTDTDPSKGLVNYLQGKLNTAFGAGKVTVSENSGKISFTTADATSIFSVDSSDAIGILGKNGALHTYAGDSNRINTKKMLEDVTDLSTPLTPNSSGGYEINVNGKQFAFSKTDTLKSIMDKINNDADANVSISYSSVTDHFTVTAKNGGSSGSVNISDVSGNLANALFGASGSDYTVSAGQDAKVTMSFNGDAASATEITRPDNNFTIDGVNINLLTTYNTVDNPNTTPITFTESTKTDDLYTKLKSFIDDYNGIVTNLYKQITETKPTDETYDPLTDAQKKSMSETQITDWNTKAKQGLMHGDSIMSSLDTDMRRAMTDMVSSVSTALSQIGISTKAYGEDGQLVIDETTLKKALSDNPDKVASMFTGTDGIATRLNTVINKNITTYGGNGILIQEAGQVNSTSTDDSTLTKEINDYASQITDLKDHLKTEQDRYYNEFTQLETYLSKMNAYASYFSSGSSSSNS